MNSKVLSEKFFRRSTVTVARELIGKQLFRKKGTVTFSARIVETEAYLPSDDSACHAAVKRTARNQVMFFEGGIAYVYAIHAKVLL